MRISAKTKTALRLFHKYIGFIFSIFIFQLTVTGIMLLYPHFFRLNDSFVSNNYILKKYNMLNIEDAKIFGDKDNELVLLGESLYFKKVLLDSIEEKIINALYIPSETSVFVFLKKKINIYKLEFDKDQFDIIDIKEKNLKEEIVKIGKDKKNVIHIMTKNSYIEIQNQELRPVKNNIKLKWLLENEKNKNIAKDYLVVHQGKGVPLHRIITELHNGKILGSFLSYLLLLASISLLFLIFSSFFFGINIKREKNDKNLL